MKKFTHTHQVRLGNHQPTAQHTTDRTEYQIITHWMVHAHIYEQNFKENQWQQH